MEKLSQFRLSLKVKLIGLSAFLLTIPWLGYQYVWEMERVLRHGQEQNLVGTARAVATALHERPGLFNQYASFIQQIQTGRDLYAYTMEDPIQLDGRLNDWPNFASRALEYDASYVLDNIEPASNSMTFKHMLFRYNRFLYLAFEVKDDDLVFRPDNVLSVSQNDFLKIAFVSQQGLFKQYIVANQKDGWSNAYLVDDDNKAVQPEARIQGHWRTTAQGYNLELRIPTDMVGTKVGFSVTDIDRVAGRAVKQTVIGTSDTSGSGELGTVLIPSADIEAIIRGLAHSRSRIWVIDKHGRVLARSGDIKPPVTTNQTASNGVMDWFQQQVLRPIYYRILTKPPADFVDQLADAIQLRGSEIQSALNGKADTLWQLSPDKKAVLLSAAHPVYLDDKVMGAVVVEETTHGIRTVRNKSLEKLFNIMLAVLSLGVAGFFLFARHISTRITKLRDQAEFAVDEQGRVRQKLPTDTANDEIGDLSRSFSDVVDRLGQYNRYLEAMSARMSHEFKTPIAIIRSSLESMSYGQISQDNMVYLDRAMEGIQRLNLIQTKMSEATKLEQTIQTMERSQFDLLEVISGCAQGHKIAFESFDFRFSCQGSSLIADGCPEFIAQMMDKVLANAMEFNEKDKPIKISLIQRDRIAELKIANTGPCLPEQMTDRIFDSMVSVRENDPSAPPHLGLGLYIVRLIAEYHGGGVQACNTENGVEIQITLALVK